ncbi:hypothetical protein [Dankookia sp. P2]|uniref:hypothetical protein n=1 Tax=Dankookia sp. P2 TaxID=3423955 RepID=UPI003D677948
MVNDNLLVDRPESPIMQSIISIYEDVASDQELSGISVVGSGVENENGLDNIKKQLNRLDNFKSVMKKHAKIAITSATERHPCKECSCQDFVYFGGFRCNRCLHDCEAHDVC